MEAPQSSENKKKEWWAYCGKIHRSRIAAGEETQDDFVNRMAKETETRRLSRDPIAELDMVIDSVLNKSRRNGGGAALTPNQKNSFKNSQLIRAIFDRTDGKEAPLSDPNL